MRGEWVEALRIGSDQATRPEGLDVVRAYGVCCCALPSDSYCDRCDLLVGLDGFHVAVVEYDGGVGLSRVVVESPPERRGLPFLRCRGRQPRPTRRHGWSTFRAWAGRFELVWRKRTWRCEEPTCPPRSFTERDEHLARPRALVDDAGVLVGDRADAPRTRIRSKGSPGNWGRRGARCGRAIKALLEALAGDESRFDGVKPPWRG